MSKPPIFESIFGVPWANLPPVMQKHYAVRPDSNDRVVVRGTMNVKRNCLMRLMSPLLKLFGALVPYDGEGIPVTVAFYSGPNSSDFHFDRTFQFPAKTFRFHSRLIPIAGGDVIEVMRSGMGWRSRYQIEDGHISLSPIGYYWRIGNWNVPLPITWMIGVCTASEDVLTDNGFKMQMTITHPIFGETYRYEGTFEIDEVTSA